MANIRSLKKAINSLTYELVDECTIFKQHHPNVSSESVDNVIGEIIDKRNELIEKCNHFPKEDKNANAYARKIAAELNDSLLAKMDKLQEFQK
ncbi:MAG: hypothetical protein HC896_18205 [Bacteroidales bacterium]|nr:hypothetical protein [Bacteroidales bacterium]